MEDAIFTFEGIVKFCLQHFSDTTQASTPFQLRQGEEQQLATLELQMREKSQPQFGFIIDLSEAGSGPIIRHPILHKALFDKADRLDFRFFIESIHPDYRQAYLWFGQASYLTIKHPEVRKIIQEGLDLRYVFALPLCRNKDQPESKRVYEWWQQNAQILRLGPTKILQSHLNQYTYLSSYQSLITQKGAIFSDIIATGGGNPETTSLFTILKSFMIPAFLEALPANERKIAQAHLAGKETVKEVVEFTAYPVSTVRTYHSRLLKRINPPEPLFPGKSFTTIKNAFRFLRMFKS